ncbi:MAG: chemotaxis protein CheD [Spirochaetaceae bacterium]|nr:chemotaxis protein CheD [Spirochaetaceae bacterium]
MQKIYNLKLKREVMNIFPGEYYISSDNEIISTLLGSCISVCLYDKFAGVGGMNHFMLPKSLNKKETALIDKSHINQSYRLTRYGLTSMEVLILEMQKKGADRRNITAKVFGGGKTIINKSVLGIGDQNIKFIKSYLKVENIPLTSENTGDSYARKVLFNTGDNSVLLEKIPMKNAIETEKDYIEQLENTPKKNEVIYF